MVGKWPLQQALTIDRATGLYLVAYDQHMPAIRGNLLDRSFNSALQFSEGGLTGRRFFDRARHELGGRGGVVFPSLSINDRQISLSQARQRLVTPCSAQ